MRIWQILLGVLSACVVGMLAVFPDFVWSRQIRPVEYPDWTIPPDGYPLGGAPGFSYIPWLWYAEIAIVLLLAGGSLYFLSPLARRMTKWQIAFAFLSASAMALVVAFPPYVWTGQFMDATGFVPAWKIPRPNGEQGALPIDWYREVGTVLLLGAASMYMVRPRAWALERAAGVCMWIGFAADILLAARYSPSVCLLGAVLFLAQVLVGVLVALGVLFALVAWLQNFSRHVKARRSAGTN